MSNNIFLKTLLDGVEVEWKPLGEIAETYGGLTGKSKADFADGNAKYITYKNIFNNIHIDESQLELVKVKDNERQHQVQYGDILFTGSSEVAEEAGMSSAVTTEFAEPVYLNSFSFGVRFNDSIKLVPEFSKYLFRSQIMRTEIAKAASGVTRFNISKARFKKLLVPVPCPENPKKSLEIQTEIVRILDAFTELTAELTAERAAREKQYNHYRNQLLSFEEGEVEWKPLGEVCGFKNGFAFKSNLFREAGLPIVRITNVNGSSVDLGEVKYFDPADYKEDTQSYAVILGDILIAMSGATTGKIGYFASSQVAYLNQRVGKFIPQAEALDSRYLYHFLLSRTSEIYILAGGGAQPNLSSKVLMEKLCVPIPYAQDPIKSMVKQKRIADILDKLDTLANSISEGLPREIELRQKQYEYYRDLLLSFPRPEEEAA